MKKLLAMIMALMLVFTLSAGIIVAADKAQQELSEEEMQALMEQLEASEGAEAEPVAEPELPEGVDLENILEVMVYDFSNPEEYVIKSAYSANDATLEYIKSTLQDGQEGTEETICGKKCLVVSSTPVTAEELSTYGIAEIVDEGLFVDKAYISIPLGNFSNSGLEEGKTVGLFVMNYSGSNVDAINAKVTKGVVEREITVGVENSFIVVKNTYDWIAILIALMILVVIILVIVVLLIVAKAKKKKKVEEVLEESEEENVLDILESSEDEVVAADEFAEEVVEEVVEVVEEVEVEATEEASEEDK